MKGRKKSQEKRERKKGRKKKLTGWDIRGRRSRKSRKPEEKP